MQSGFGKTAARGPKMSTRGSAVLHSRYAMVEAPVRQIMFS